MTNPSAAASLPNKGAIAPETGCDPDAIPADIPGLEKHLADVELLLSNAQNSIRELMAREDPARGIFHAEAIHEAKQRHMQLRYVKDFCAARLARLRAGF